MLKGKTPPIVSLLDLDLKTLMEIDFWILYIQLVTIDRFTLDLIYVWKRILYITIFGYVSCVILKDGYKE